MSAKRKAKHDRPSQVADDAPPRPTYAPAFLALGTMMTFWGILTLWVMSAFGICLMIAALWIWIHEIRNRWKTS